MKEKFSLRDLIYLFVIIDMFFILVFVTTLYWRKYVTDYSLIMDQISLASGIASIILAIVAIIYAFFQSHESGKQSKAIEDLLSQMSQKVEEIGPLKQEVADSKREMTQVLAGLSESLFRSFQQFDSQIKESRDDLGSKVGEIYKSFFDNYIQTAITEINTNTQNINSKKPGRFQDFYVILVTDGYKVNRELNDNIPIEYIKYFREKTLVWAIASNIVVFSDYTGLSFTLSLSEEKEWTPKEIQQAIEGYSVHELSVFTVAKLFYG